MNLNSWDNYDAYLVDWLKECVKDANLKGVVIGVSGGIDSALVATLCYKAFGENALAITLPCEGQTEDLEFSNDLFKVLPINNINLDITGAYEELKRLVPSNDKKMLGNIKARIRMTTLYAKAQELGYLVVGTDNAAEWLTGYFTKHGDGGVDLVPLLHMTKKQVRDMSAKLGVPESIINRAPTASLFAGQTDEEEMGVTYDEIDAYLNGEEISNSSKDVIERLSRVSAHKRELAKSPKKIIK